MWLLKWILFCLAAIPVLMIVTGRISLGQDYRTANRDSAGIAPDPKATREAVVQVYAARALNWRGIFGVHTWIVTKPENADEFTIHQVIGWRLMRNLSGLFSEAGIPDRNWFGNRPELLADVRGPEAADAIDKVLKAVASYPTRTSIASGRDPTAILLRRTSRGTCRSSGCSFPLRLSAKISPSTGGPLTARRAARGCS